MVKADTMVEVEIVTTFCLADYSMRNIPIRDHQKKEF